MQYYQGFLFEQKHVSCTRRHFQWPSTQNHHGSEFKRTTRCTAGSAVRAARNFSGRELEILRQEKFKREHSTGMMRAVDMPRVLLVSFSLRWRRVRDLCASGSMRQQRYDKPPSWHPIRLMEISGHQPRRCTRMVHGYINLRKPSRRS